MGPLRQAARAAARRRRADRRRRPRDPAGRPHRGAGRPRASPTRRWARSAAAFVIAGFLVVLPAGYLADRSPHAHHRGRARVVGRHLGAQRDRAQLLAVPRRAGRARRRRDGRQPLVVIAARRLLPARRARPRLRLPARRADPRQRRSASASAGSSDRRSAGAGRSSSSACRARSSRWPCGGCRSRPAERATRR